MELSALERIVSEWVRGADLPAMTRRDAPLPDLAPPRPILSVVGPRRAGKTYFVYQLIGSLLGSGKTFFSSISKTIASAMFVRRTSMAFWPPFIK